MIEQRPPRRPWSDGRFHVQGHRGAGGLFPENTLDAFHAARENGCAGIELDVRLSADGQPVVWHDEVLDPAKCRFADPAHAGARVDQLSLAQLRTVDVGSQTAPEHPMQQPAPGAGIRTLAEVFAALQDSPHLGWTVEIKVDPTDPAQLRTRHTLVEAVIATIREAGVADRALIHSFDWAVLELAAALADDLPRSALAMAGYNYFPASPWLGSVGFEAHRWDLSAAAVAAGAQVVSPYHLWCQAELVDRAHELGLGVLAWTVNTAQESARLRALGVDGVITDRPDLVTADG